MSLTKEEKDKIKEEEELRLKIRSEKKMEEEKLQLKINAEKQLKDAKGFIGCLIFIVFFLYSFSFLFGENDSLEKNNILEKKSENKIENTILFNYDQTTPEGKIERCIVKDLGEKENDIVSIDFFGEQLHITINGNENLTNHLTFKSIINQIKKIMPAIGRNVNTEKIKVFKIAVLLPMIDQYGNEKLSYALKIFLKREIVNKINWENIMLEQLIDIAKKEDRGGFFIHPDFTK